MKTNQGQPNKKKTEEKKIKKSKCHQNKYPKNFNSMQIQKMCFQLYLIQFNLIYFYENKSSISTNKKKQKQSNKNPSPSTTTSKNTTTKLIPLIIALKQKKMQQIKIIIFQFSIKKKLIKKHISSLYHKMRLLKSSQQPRYRSVKYKLAKQSSRKSDKISTQRKNYQPLAGPCLDFKNKIKPLKLENSHTPDFRNTYSTLQSPDQSKMRKTTYMQTFYFMLNMQKNKYNTKDKTLNQQNKIDKLQQDQPLDSSRLDRVFLPTLNQLNSYFTVLDNINLPIQYINQQIVKINAGIQVEVANVKKIAIQLKQIKKKHENSLAELQIIGIKGFDRLRGLLRGNKVYQQQQTMKHKNGVQKNKNYIPKFIKQFQISKQKILLLQDIIFKGIPFQLVQRQEFIQLSNQYF